MTEEEFRAHLFKILNARMHEPINKDTVRNMITDIYDFLKEYDIVCDIICDDQLNAKEDIDNGAYKIGLRPRDFEDILIDLK